MSIKGKFSIGFAIAAVAIASSVLVYQGYQMHNELAKLRADNTNLMLTIGESSDPTQSNRFDRLESDYYALEFKVNHELTNNDNYQSSRLDKIEGVLKYNIVDPATEENYGTYAYGSTRPWSQFITRISVAQRALENGDIELAKTSTIDALAGLGTFCHSRDMPQAYLPVELQELVKGYFRFSEPETTQIEYYGGGPIVRVGFDTGC